MKHKSRSKKAILTEGKIGKTLINLTLPMIISMFGIVAFNLIDTFYVGKLGANELAALSFTFPVVLVINSIALGIGMGGSAVISRAIGEGDHHKVQLLTTSGIILVIIIAIVILIIGEATISSLFGILGARDDILELVKTYMRVWYFGVPFVVVPMFGNNAIRATGDSKTPSMIMIGAVVTNMIFDPLLIFGIGPFPRLEISGAALATVFGRFTVFSLASWVLIHREKMINFHNLKINATISAWKSILFIGIPIAISRMLLPLSMGVITRIIAQFGPKAVAGFGVATRIEFFALATVRALSSVFGPFIGQNIGSGKIERVKRGIFLSKRFSLFWGFFIFLILILSARPVASLFNKDEKIVQTIILYLSIVPVSYGIQGILLICTTTLNVLKKPYEAAGIIFLQMFILYIPLAYFGAIYYQTKGIFWGAAISYSVSGITSHYILKRKLVEITE